jgi:hypothetical protein
MPIVVDGMQFESFLNYIQRETGITKINKVIGAKSLIFRDLMASEFKGKDAHYYFSRQILDFFFDVHTKLRTRISDVPKPRVIETSKLDLMKKLLSQMRSPL